MPDPRARGNAAARPGGGRPAGRTIALGPMVRRSDPLESTPPAFGDEAVLALAGFIVVISWKSRVVRKPQGPEAFWACSGAHPCPSGRITGRHRGMRGTGTAITRPRWSAWTTPPGPCSPRLIAEPPRVHFPASDSGSRVHGGQRSVEVAHEKVAEFPGVAERDAMTAGNLVRDDAQALLCHPPQEGGGEELVVFAEDELGGHVRPRIKRPGRIPDRRGFPAPAPSQGFCGQRARYAVVVADERVVVAGVAAIQPGLLLGGLPVAGVAPPLARGLSGGRDHSGEQHE